MKNFYYALLLLFIVAYLTPAQNYSLSFDGNSYVSVPHSDTLNLSNHLTIECWFTVQGASLNDWIGIVCKLDASSVSYSGYFFGLGQGANYPNWINFYIYPSGENINCSFSPTLNQWYNLAVTYNGSIMKMFLDGNLIQEKAATGLIASNTFPLTIGGQNGNFWNRNLNGKIDEVRISSVARYDSNFIPTTHFDNDIYTIALYHFNEGTDDIVYDSSGNNLNGTIYGAIWSNDVPGVTAVPQNESLNSPNKFVLSPNFPNPFNPNTVISYQLPVGSDVTLKVYDNLGNEIATLVDEYKPAGTYEVEFNASSLPSGIYFYKIRAGYFVETKKMVLLK
jgi:hypothetical protein